MEAAKTLVLSFRKKSIFLKMKHRIKNDKFLVDFLDCAFDKTIILKFPSEKHRNFFRDEMTKEMTAKKIIRNNQIQLSI